MQQPSPKPQTRPDARQTADTLRDQYGSAAISGARVALRAAGGSGDAEAIKFWDEVCTVLATDRTIRF